MMTVTKTRNYYCALVIHGLRFIAALNTQPIQSGFYGDHPTLLPMRILSRLMHSFSSDSPEPMSPSLSHPLSSFLRFSWDRPGRSERPINQIDSSRVSS